jgi:hypothetical protein
MQVGIPAYLYDYRFVCNRRPRRERCCSAICSTMQCCGDCQMVYMIFNSTKTGSSYRCNRAIGVAGIADIDRHRLRPRGGGYSASVARLAAARAAAASFRNSISSGVDCRPRIALRCGKRPNRSMTST